MPHKFLSSLILLVTISALAGTGPVPGDSAPVLRLRLATFNPANIDQLGIPDELLIESYPPDVSGTFIVQFRGPLTESQTKALKAAGAWIVGYIPDFAFLVIMDNTTREAVSAWASSGKFDTVFCGIYQPAFKISPELFGYLSGSHQESGRATIVVQQFAREPESLDRLAGLVRSSGADASLVGSSIWKDKQRLAISVAAADLAQLVTQLARVPCVVWISKYHPPVLLNDQSRWICQSFVSGQTPVWEKGIHGEGQIVGVGDTGVDADMCYFYDGSQGLPDETINNDQRKIIVYYDLSGSGDWDGYGHGTHVAGSIAGDNLADIGGYDYCDGMAYCAKLVVQDIGSGGSLDGLPYDLNSYFGQARAAGARLHSNSWGSYGDTSYDSYCQDVDEFMWDNPDFLVLFAAGNDGPDAHTVTSPATAKDAVSVGATQNAYSGLDPENVASFSSNGPTDDGRIKPTVCAPGHYVISAYNDYDIHSYNCDLTGGSGTSMACPTAAGLAALVRQYYLDGFYPTGEANEADGFEPSAALVKATLVNSARSMTGENTDGPIPSTGQGWGRILLDDALYFLGDECPLAVYDVQPGLSTGQSDVYYAYCDGSCKLEVTLTWTDYPSSLAAETNLVNDLDLTVIAPDETSYLGNNYSDGHSVPGGTADRLNVVECVQIDSPQTGTYEIVVSAHNVPYPQQPYALVITGGYGGGNVPPTLSDGTVSPNSGCETDTFTYSVHYYDEDGDTPVTKSVFINGEAHEMSLDSGSEANGTYAYSTLLPAGTHNYYFYFTDGQGGKARLPAAGTYSGPSVDGSPPESHCWCDQYSASPVIVNFSASDAESGVYKTDLYYKFGSAGWWTYTGLSRSGTAGYFSFELQEGEGAYYFYTISTDGAGNVEDAPGEADCVTIYDSEPPSSVCSGPEYASSDFEITFTADDQDGSGVDQTCLWYRYESGSWKETGQPQHGQSGTFPFTPADGNGSYFFYTISTDLAGNQEVPPAAYDCIVVVETTKPQSHCTAPRFSNSRDVAVDYSASDDLSGVEFVRLWYRVGTGSWLNSGLEESGPTGSFDFHISGDEGRYYFCSIAQDRAGNVEDAPGSPDTFVIFDATPPESFCTAPSCSPVEQIKVDFSAQDAGSSVAQTRLFAKFEGGQWEETGLSEPGITGQFAFVGTHGEGRYYFYTVCTDNAGNTEEPPATYDAMTIVDATPPSSSCLSPTAASTTFTVSFVATDEGCGINQTALWWRFDDSQWQQWADPVGQDTGVYEFTPPSGDGLYQFYTVALDLAGNQEEPPLTADTTTLFDTLKPSSSSSCAEYSTIPTIAINFSASDQGSGIATTALWYRFGQSAFVDSGLVLAGNQGTFDFAAVQGEGRYEFYTISADNAGNHEVPPDSPDASCIFDKTAPSSVCSSPQQANQSPIAIAFEAEDAVSGIDQTILFYRYEDGQWEDSGLVETGESGTFLFSVPDGNGTYYFSTRAIDKAGNVEELLETPDCSCGFDDTIPLSECSCPAVCSAATVAVSYQASGGISGLAQVELWYVFNGHEAQDSGLQSTEPEGTFVFSPDEGDGLYGFFTIASNNDGLTEQAPPQPDCLVLIDTTPPTTSCAAPQYATSAPVAVSFEASDELFEVTDLWLYYRIDGGQWQLAERKPGATAGTFEFAFAAGEGSYDFQVTARDELGNSNSLGDLPCSTTVYDHSAPSSSCITPAFSSKATIEVSYQAQDAVSGVAEVKLYYRLHQGDWEYWGICPEGQAGSFSLQLPQQEGPWSFATVAEDLAGNAEQLGPDADSVTVVDFTAPTVTASSVAWTSQSTVLVGYEAADQLSGLSQAVLWYRYESGAWVKTQILSAQPKDQLQFEFTDGEGAYDFWVEALDFAGNTTGEPTAPQAATIFDASPPTSSCQAPEYATSSPISVSFDASDLICEELSTELFYRFESGVWTSSGQVLNGQQGTFEFAAGSDGIYEFYTVSTDLAGNRQAQPGEAPRCSTILDTTAPTSVCYAPAFTSVATIAITFEASDETSGVLETALWLKFEYGDWENTGLVAGGETGEFAVGLSMGQGRYYFHSISKDKASNIEPAKSLPDTVTIYDFTAPTSSCESPAYATGPFDVGFVAQDGLSGIKEVVLFYSYADSAWIEAGVVEGATGGTFHFSPQEGDGAYSFATVAKDEAGNLEALGQQADSTTIFDTVPPTSRSSCWEITNQSQIEVEFTATDSTSGIRSVSLWMSFDGGPFVSTGLSEAGRSGTFGVSLNEGDGEYAFYTIAEDLAGLVEKAPEQAECSVVLDTLAPTSSCAATSSTRLPYVDVSFVAEDERTGVAETKLWYRLSGQQTWNDTGLSIAGQTGSFRFTFPDGEGLYEFQTTAIDNAGNQEDLGSVPCASTEYRTAAPVISVSEESHNFGPVQTGNISTWQVEIRNIGTAELVVEQIASDGEPYYVGGPDQFTLQPQEQIALNIFFLPPAATALPGSITIRSNDPETPEKTIPLSGSGFEGASPFLSVVTDRAEYHPLDTILAFYVLGNPGEARMADAYLAAVFPGDQNLYFFPQWSTVPAPLQLYLPAGTYVAPTALFALDLTTPIPQGEYILYACLCSPGTQFELISDLSVASFTFK